MNEVERYLFDLQGYIHIPCMLTAEESRRLHRATMALEEDALASRDESSRWRAVWGHECWRHPRHGYFNHGERAEKMSLMVEDFWLYPEAFDMLIGHERTMQYVKAVISERDRTMIAINNSELRIRYKGNRTGLHLGYPTGREPKYLYRVTEGRINCMMVRMVYFTHDVSADDGPMCFVPGSHRGELPVPAGLESIEQQPGLVAVPVKAGDAILFTEACRHGGMPILSNQTRYTLHVGYGPHFLKSQNICTMEEEVNVNEALLARLTPEQRKLMVCDRREPLGR